MFLLTLFFNVIVIPRDLIWGDVARFNDLNIFHLLISWKTWRWVDDRPWARMNVFRTSFYVPASKERNPYFRHGRDVDATFFSAPKTKKNGQKTSTWAQITSSSQRHVQMWRTMDDPCINGKISRALALPYIFMIQLPFK